jgi:hypothetical protein
MQVTKNCNSRMVNHHQTCYCFNLTINFFSPKIRNIWVKRCKTNTGKIKYLEFEFYWN